MHPLKYLSASSSMIKSVLDSEKFETTKEEFGDAYEIFTKKLADALEFSIKWKFLASRYEDLKLMQNFQTVG